MSENQPGQHTLTADDVEAWMAHHPQTTVWIFAFLLWISVSLIFRMWLVHRKASLIKKVL